MAEVRTVKVGEVIIIERDSNAPSTGYDWVITKLEGPIGLLSTEFHRETLPGRGRWKGTKVFYFAGLQAGNASIQLARMRAWEPDKAVYEDVITYTIEEKAEKDSETNELLGITAGGWTGFKALDADADAAFKSALGTGTEPELVGVKYTPLLFSRQTVEGKNFLFVVNAKVATDDTRTYAALIRIYREPGKDPVITGITNIGHPGFVGSYGAFDKPSTEASTALGKALAPGLDFKPDYAATQIVSGRNYLFAGTANYVTLAPDSFPAFVTVYAPLDGAPRITEVKAAYEL
jgi:predicted secreted protein